MFTESSNPTIAKNASDVAAVTARNALLSAAVSNATTREKSTSAPPVNAHNPTSDHQQQAADLDDRQYHVELDAFADAAQVDGRKQRHEQQRHDDDSGLAPIEVERR